MLLSITCYLKYYSNKKKIHSTDAYTRLSDTEPLGKTIFLHFGLVYKIQKSTEKLILILEKSPELPLNHHVYQNTDSMRSQDMSKNLAMTRFVCPTSP